MVKPVKYVFPKIYTKSFKNSAGVVLFTFKMFISGIISCPVAVSVGSQFSWKYLAFRNNSRLYPVKHNVFHIVSNPH